MTMHWRPTRDCVKLSSASVALNPIYLYLLVTDNVPGDSGQTRMVSLPQASKIERVRFYGSDPRLEIDVLLDRMDEAGRVTTWVPATFEITDELYLSEVFEDDVQPLLASDYRFERDNFYSARKAVAERKMFDNEGWEHAPGSNLIGWTRTEGASRIVYLQCGDDPVAYANPHFQTLLKNAIEWASGAG